MDREYGPSQAQEMMRGLVEAAEEMRRNDLVLTHSDAQLLEEIGISTPARMDEYFRCTVCGTVMREGIDFFIMPNGDLRCSEECLT
jgi:hypothetical protein